MNKLLHALLSLLLFISCSASMAQSGTANNTLTKYYSLYDDGGEHVANACEISYKLPSNLKKTLTKAEGYLGTKQIEFSAKNEAGIDAYQHYYANLKDCNRAMKKLGYEN